MTEHSCVFKKISCLNHVLECAVIDKEVIDPFRFPFAARTCGMGH